MKKGTEWFAYLTEEQQSPEVHNHFHIVYLTGENKCTGTNIEAVDMIDALTQFEVAHKGVKPIYCYAK